MEEISDLKLYSWVNEDGQFIGWHEVYDVNETGLRYIQCRECSNVVAFKQNDLGYEMIRVYGKDKDFPEDYYYKRSNPYITCPICLEKNYVKEN